MVCEDSGQRLSISASEVSLPVRQSSAMEQQAQGLVNIFVSNTLNISLLLTYLTHQTKM
jgi:hypothetical protein